MLRPFGILLGTLSLCVASSGCEERASAEPPHPAIGMAPRKVQGVQAGVPGAGIPMAESANVGVPDAGIPNSAGSVEGALELGWVYSKARFVWIYPEPTTELRWIGYLWTGGAVRLRSAERVRGKGCAPGWSAIEPRGYVCADGIRATLDPNDSTYQALKKLTGNLDSPWPHAYGESEGSPALIKFPLGPASDPLNLPSLSSSSHDPYEEFPRHSTVAYVKEFHAGNQDWLLTADLRWLPKPQVTPYVKSEFEGVRLDGKVSLPIAFFRAQPRPQYHRNPSGSFEPTGAEWPRLAWVALSSERVIEKGVSYVKVLNANTFVRETDAVIPQVRVRTPWGARVGKPDTSVLAPKGRATWIEASIRGGWLIAYEGTRPVFTTLISAGRGGPPKGQKPLLKTGSTPIGSFPITGKFATSTFANDAVIHSAVPWTQNFDGPYALHSAYWHNDFGELKSGGCLNLSPKDARYLFDFTDPQLPAGWHGVRWVPKEGASTLVHIIR